MPSRDLAYALDVLNAARSVQTFMAGVDKTSFERDLMRQSAVVRQIEVMGEAQNEFQPRLGTSIRTYPGVKSPGCVIS